MGNNETKPHSFRKSKKGYLEAKQNSGLELLLDNLNAIVFRAKYNPNHTMLYLSMGFEKITKYKRKVILNDKETSYMNLVHPDDRELVTELISNAINKRESYEVVYRIITKKDEIEWVQESGTVLFLNSVNDVLLEGLIQLIDIRKEDFTNIKLHGQSNIKEVDRKEYLKPEYGDLTNYNRQGKILKAIGKEMLKKVGEEYLSLTDSFTSIFEIDGSYALNLCLSKWCKLLSESSRKQCNTNDNSKAIQSKKWLCYESCWTNSALKAIKEKKTVDTVCEGGLCLYSVPIFAKNEIVGVVNLSYGKPPLEVNKIQEIATKYNIGLNTLLDACIQYNGRPTYVSDLAKSSVNIAAKFIGEIIERKLIEDKLNYEKHFTNKVFNTAVDTIFVFNPGTGKAIRWNKNFEIISGYNAQEIDKLKAPQSYYSKEDLNKAIPFIEEVKREGEGKIELELITKDNKKISTEYAVSALRLDSGEIILISIGRDISERKTTEFVLKENEENLRITLNSIGEGVITLNNKGEIVRLNPAAQKLTGWKIKEAFKKPLNEVFKILNNTNKLENIKHIKYRANTEEISKLPTSGILIAKSGKRIPISNYIAPIKNDLGEVTGTVLTFKDQTKEMEYKQKLLESKITAERYLDIAAQIILALDKNGNIVLLNDSGHKILGYKKGEISGKNWFDTCLPPQKANENKNAFKMLMRGSNKGLNYENPIKRKNGNELIILWYYTVLKDNNGNINGLLCSGKDITDIKRAEKALVISEERYNLAMQAANDGIFDLDLVSNKIYFSPRWKKMLGYKENEIKNDISEWKRLIWSEDLKKSEEILKEHLEGKRNRFEIEYKMKHKNGQWIDILLRASATFDEEGKPSRLIGTHVDISERKHIEEALKRSEEIFRSFLENINLVGLILDKEGNMLFVNDYMLELTGWKRQEVLYKNWFEYLISEENRESIKYIFHSTVVEKAFPITYEIELVTKKGKKKIIRMSNTMVCDEYGNVKTVTSIGEDITEHKKFEDQLKQLNEELRNQNEVYLALNDEQNKTLSQLQNINIELKEANKKAEESDKLKSAFLANMSHEIRTPMNGIVGFTDLLKEKDLEEERKQKYIGVIQQSTDRMLSMINDLIDISIIETGQIEIKIEKTDLNNLLHNIYILYKPIAQEKQLKFSCKTEPEQVDIQIETDELKLKQIISHLIKNAIKYTDKGRIHFGYSIKGEQIEFFVKDTGIGIDDNMYMKIFECFRQVNLNVGSADEGSGLGLSISKAFVEMLGGNIWLESKPGYGSTFYFTHPYKRLDNPIEPTPEIHIKKEDMKEQVTILIAEDDEISYLYLKEIAAEANMKAIRALNGNETIELCRKHPEIRLVLMDIKMPEMNGYDATKVIKKFRPNLPIIAQTAYALTRDKERALEAGCDGYLSKPIKKSELLYFLHKIN